jgi:uncharacterized protein
MASEVVALTREDGRVVCERLLVAVGPFQRMRGLLGRKELPAGEGILLRPAGSIHMFFMRFAIDAIFLDEALVVIDVVPDLQPWRMAGRRGAKAVVELASGECARRGIEPGDALMLS